MTDQVTAAFAGGESAFAALTERYRRELHVHCYRMLASFDEAEDAVQETFLRAWRSRDSFDGSGLVRAWLYKIATNVCLDAIRRTGRRPKSLESIREVPWITPYPDRLLDEMSPPEEEPDAVVVTRETIELAFLAALQVLPPRQRAAADRAGRAGLAGERDGIGPGHDGGVGEQRAAAGARDAAGAHAREADGLVARANRVTPSGRCWRGSSRPTSAAMPPWPFPSRRRTCGSRCHRHRCCSRGSASSGPLLENAFADGSSWRLVPTVANRMPTAASYLKTPGDDTYRAFKLDVLRVVDGRIAEITTFGWSLFSQFGLPATLDG